MFVLLSSQMNQSIHVRPYKSCFPTPKRGERTNKISNCTFWAKPCRRDEWKKHLTSADVWSQDQRFAHRNETWKITSFSVNSTTLHKASVVYATWGIFLLQKMIHKGPILGFFSAPHPASHHPASRYPDFRHPAPVRMFMPIPPSKSRGSPGNAYRWRLPVSSRIPPSILKLSGIPSVKMSKSRSQRNIFIPNPTINGPVIPYPASIFTLLLHLTKPMLEPRSSLTLKGISKTTCRTFN